MLTLIAARRGLAIYSPLSSDRPSGIGDLGGISSLL
jgi:hypothetical protein